ncbi:MAG: hypothetical protein HC809_10495 [Gammaproteobacteria bacterium]|nr:hypothetical protein [Gammaproteobacteria bacterium]
MYLCSNSKTAFERVLFVTVGKEVNGRQANSLGDTLEFRYIRTLMPLEAKEENGLVYLSDPFIRHRCSFPVVAAILGGEDAVRFSEFNLRETPRDAGIGTMNFHHDAVLADRLLRKPYMPCDWLCAIHYLTDVAPGTPSFCVVPGSNAYATLKEAFEGLGEHYQEVPIFAPAGSCVLYDTATFHTRLDGDGEQGRRTWHQYYARGGWLPSTLPTTNKYVRPPSPVLTDWNLFPERLALHADPKIRRYFSHWNTAQCEWVASGFDAHLRRSMPRGEQ